MRNYVGKNKDIMLDLLFEVDGVKIYRFIDMGHSRYIAIQNNKISVISETEERQGKRRIYEDSTIETIVKWSK